MYELDYANGETTVDFENTINNTSALSIFNNLSELQKVPAPLKVSIDFQKTTVLNYDGSHFYDEYKPNDII